MNSPNISKQAQITLILTVCVCVFLTLSSALIFITSGDLLLTITLSSVIIYLLIYFAYKIYCAWWQPIEQFESFLYAKHVEQNNSDFTLQKAHSITDMIRHFEMTVQTKSVKLDTVLFEMFGDWSIPIAVFDDKGALVFFNHPMYLQLNTPLLRGMQDTECGFILDKGRYTHSALSEDWQIHSVQLDSGRLTLISTHFIGQQIQAAKRQSQADLIRVLSHELNNSLAPMASMTDTLLQCDSLPEQSTRQALTRIKNRSESLLSFIKAFAELTHLPEPKITRFNLFELAHNNANEQNVLLDYRGDHYLFADRVLFEQLLINLLKNAKEAVKCNARVQLQSNYQGKWHVLIIQDNGPGFANLDNALNPLYTTKQNGQGLGLALSHDILQKHGGQLVLSNTGSGAQIEIKLPLNNIKNNTLHPPITAIKGHANA